MNIKDLVGEATEYDKKLEVEIKKPKSWCKNVFNRLGYMERKGSGFGKIIGGYEFQIN